MPNRILKESICTSDSIDHLSIEAERLFYRLIVNCDDFGLLDARLPIVKSKCFPLKSSDITDDQLKSWLSELEAQNMIFFYENSGHEYLKMSSWERHQQTRAHRSKCPLPNDERSHMKSDDIIGNQMFQKSPDTRYTIHDTRNTPIAPTGGEKEGPQGESLPVQTATGAEKFAGRSMTLEDRFNRFWKAYPKKVGKGAAERSFKKYKPNEVLLVAMLEALKLQRRSDQWQRDGGQYIPNPATWLNQKRWEDEAHPGRKDDFLP
ncbi:hypothetical protein EQM14_01520 [Caproiciproducens sp. NJN-50]|uniref:hypothetical protein n=1 Tax=Caproiciproducens sp. NJN-50 TaxID=2507162 RepID=UPI000FFE2384|nr:hypothetical protein [Caproiciproducens sp. NJN-50]QAT48563.1 hypothetical protein EQM14_01520 [Caproiciproducens sp. NJN-50]